MRVGRPPSLILILVPAVALLGACDRDRPDAGPPDAAPPPVAAPALLPPVAAGDLEVVSAVVAEPVTGERTAAYFTIHDRGTGGDALVGLASPRAGRATVHRTETREGVSVMGPAASVEVPPGGTLRLAPGGLHAMLEALSGAVAAGDTVPLTLRFRDAGEVTVPALVVPYADLDAFFPPSPSGGSP